MTLEIRSTKHTDSMFVVAVCWGLYVGAVYSAWNKFHTTYENTPIRFEYT